MKNKSLSTIGFLMDYLNIHTATLAQALHVDASLVSKWKSGNRNFSEKSVYFENVITFFLQTEEYQTLLIRALHELYPHHELQSTTETEALLRQTLSSAASHKPSVQQHLISTNANTVSALMFEGNTGRREAIFKLFDYADGMTAAGDMIFLDSEEYDWLLEDITFSEQFTRRMLALLRRGFHAKFIIHYASYRERFQRFFNLCAPLIFHRNVSWYYYEYYEENVMNLSLFLLNHAVSLFGLSAENVDCSTMVFTDSPVVLQHEQLAEHFAKQCKSLFTSFLPSHFDDIINDISHFHRKGAFYSFLPSPVFLSAREDLLHEILLDNQISLDRIEHYLSLNHKFREAISRNQTPDESTETPFVSIFQLEEMIRRVRHPPFISQSLSLLCDQYITVSSRQFSQGLSDLAEDLLTHDNMQIVFVSEKDDITLPSINCWCRENLWMIQMDKYGFRVSDEISMVNAATFSLERCMKKVPHERKVKESVSQFLIDLAEELLSQQ